MSVGTDPNKLSLHLRENSWKGFDFGRGISQTTGDSLRLGGLLRSGVTLTGTPVVVITKDGIPTTDLVIQNLTVNSGQFNDPGGIKAIRANEGIIGKFSAVEVGTYKIALTCLDTEGQMQALEGTIEVKGV